MALVPHRGRGRGPWVGITTPLLKSETVAAAKVCQRKITVRNSGNRYPVQTGIVIQTAAKEHSPVQTRHTPFNHRVHNLLMLGYVLVEIIRLIIILVILRILTVCI